MLLKVYCDKHGIFYETNYTLDAYSAKEKHKFDKGCRNIKVIMPKIKNPAKYEIEYEIQGNYGQRWEVVTYEEDFTNARRALKEYRENNRGIQFRIIRKRVKKNPAKKRKAPSKIAAAKRSFHRSHWGEKSTATKKLRAVKITKDTVLVELGKVMSIDYLTVKGDKFGFSGGGQKTRYTHSFKGTLPTLCYERKSKKLVIAGGSYKMTERGIVG